MSWLTRSRHAGGRRSSLRALATLVVMALTVGIAQFVMVAPRAWAACAGGSLYVVPHQDDDLLFISPDLLADIDADRCVRTLFLTAGDAGYQDDYWQSREQGIEAAYATMAGVSNSWSTSSVSLAGKSVRTRTLSGSPNVSLMFLRLPDGFPLGTGSAEQGYQSLKRLLDGAISSIRAVDGSASYTASTLRNAVLDAMRVSYSTTVRTLDYLSSYGSDGDHYDHHSTGFITRDASGTYSTSHLLQSYMGYDTSYEAANVSGTSLTRKTAAFTRYADYDDEINMTEYQSRGWISRQYRIASSGTVGANAGADQTVTAGQLTTLDASGSSATGTISYAWTQTAGTAVQLSSTTVAKPTFTPTAGGTYTFSVTVRSGTSSATDAVNVTVGGGTTPTTPPTTDPANLAQATGVTVTASSQDTGSGQTAAKAVDGVISGYPDDSSREWATVGGGSGSWIQLAWPSAVTIDRVVLYDRPNSNDWATGGTLTFSNGTTVAVPSLNNTGGATTVTFSPRATTSLRYTITSVGSGTENIGLSELQVYGSANQAPTANAGADRAVTANTLVTLDGSASTDPNAGTTLTYSWKQTLGATVALSSATAAKPTFTPTAAGTYTFELTVSDGALTAKDTVTITVAAANLPPTANAGADQSGTTGTLVTLNGSGTDPEGKAVTYAWAKTSGPAATLSSATVAKPTFTPASVGTYVFELTVSDGTLSAKDSVTITVAAANQAPTANAGADQSGTTGTLVTLNGSGTDPEGKAVTYAWAKTSGPAATLSSATVAKPTFTPASVGTYVFELTVSDGTLSAKDSVTITVAAPNAAPTANAGTDQSVAVNTLVTLNGSGTDPEGKPLTYSWVKTSGPGATLSNASVAKPTFTPTTAGDYVFTLTVNDGALTATDSVTIKVTQPNRAPVANAGNDQSVLVNAKVTLDGSASSDPDGTTLLYTWKQTGGTPTVTLTGATTTKPTFTPVTAGTYTFELSVSDGTLTATDSVTVVVGNPNRTPTAVAGPDQSVAVSTIVTLDGSGSSDPDAGTTLTYNWVKTSGPAATLSNAAVAKPTFTPATVGTYVFTLTVSDGTLSANDSVTVTVSQPNRAPVANAGPDQTVAVSTLVTLDGSGSTDPDGGTLTYAWTKDSGPTATLSNASSAKPTFTPASVGTYVFKLTVSDGAATHSDLVTITVAAANLPPTANAGVDQTGTTGTLVTLNGSGTDPEGKAVTYAWAKTSGPAATLSSVSVAKPTFTPASVGTYVFELTVSDGTLSAKDSVTITVAAPANLPPTANAGADQSGTTGTLVTLNGSGTDPEGKAVTYAWAKTSGPAATLSSVSVAKPTFTPASVGTYVFALTVSDGALSATDSVTITVAAPATSSNVARISGVTVTASSQNTSTSQTAAKAIDGSTVGYPSDYTREWATVGGKAGSWIQLTWSSPVTLSKVVLYDRPNTSDRITAGTLMFSDGTSVPVTSLVNAGTATTFSFSARTVTSVRLNITSVASTTENVGLAEFEAWGVPSGSGSGTPTTPVNLPPTANAGADQSGTTGTLVTLNGSGTDPEGKAVTYAWAKTSGPAATLSSVSVAKPTFTPASVGTYVFALTVSDGALSATDSVTITVAAPAAVQSNLARVSGVTATASSQNTSTSQTAAKAIDGSAVGYPSDYTREWATVGGKAGSWIQLTWSSPVTLSKVVLYDRPNASDQITSATLRFSNGTEVPVPALNNSGGATTVTFPARATTSVRLVINSVGSGTENIGLAEFEAWGSR